MFECKQFCDFHCGDTHGLPKQDDVFQSFAPKIVLGPRLVDSPVNGLGGVLAGEISYGHYVANEEDLFVHDVVLADVSEENAEAVALLHISGIRGITAPIFDDIVLTQGFRNFRCFGYLLGR